MRNRPRQQGQINIEEQISLKFSTEILEALCGLPKLRRRVRPLLSLFPMLLLFFSPRFSAEGFERKEIGVLCLRRRKQGILYCRFFCLSLAAIRQSWKQREMAAPFEVRPATDSQRERHGNLGVTVRKGLGVIASQKNRRAHRVAKGFLRKDFSVVREMKMRELWR